MPVRSHDEIGVQSYLVSMSKEAGFFVRIGMRINGSKLPPGQRRAMHPSVFIRQTS